MGPESYIGSVAEFAGNFAPKHWAPCNGQTLQIQHYNALFSVLGTIYGGDGMHTFALPDLNKDINDADGYQDKPLKCICIEGIFPPRD